MSCCDPLFDNCLFFIYSLKSIKSEIKFSSNLPTPARWKRDAVFINNKWRFIMKNTKKQKLLLFKVEKGMSLEKIRENLRTYLTSQGLEIKTNNSKKNI